MKTQIDPSGPEVTDHNHTEQSLTTTRLCLKIAEAAKVIGVNPVTVRRMIKRGLLRPYRGLRTPLIPMRQLKELIESDIEPNQELEIKSINSRYKKSGMPNRRIRKGSKGGSFCGEGVLK